MDSFCSWPLGGTQFPTHLIPLLPQLQLYKHSNGSTQISFLVQSFSPLISSYFQFDSISKEN
uniref:Uncharacterized protein n=1 Tax=Oryza brachyantha TaxID=4533 RepID=J3MUN2_ORYBR